MYRIFVSGMAYDEGKSGISDYTNNVLKELVKNHKIDFLMFKKDVDIFPFRHKNLTILTVQDSLSKPIINMLWHLFILPISRNFRKYDFIFLPAGNRRLFWIYPQFTITTFHDLSQFHIQGKYDKLRMIYIKKIIPFFLKKVHRIFAISESTKNDLMRFYHLETNKIQVNYNGYNQENFRSDIVVDRKDLPIPIDKNFLLYISRIEHPGKNHLNLIKAYEILPDEIKEQYHLVFVGKVWAGSELVSEYARNSKDSSRIHLLGFVAYDLLPKLYKAATLYVLPSLYEGFGIPLLEAIENSKTYSFNELVSSKKY